MTPEVALTAGPEAVEPAPSAQVIAPAPEPPEAVAVMVLPKVAEPELAVKLAWFALAMVQFRLLLLPE